MRTINLKSKMCAFGSTSSSMWIHICSCVRCVQLEFWTKEIGKWSRCNTDVLVPTKIQSRYSLWLVIHWCEAIGVCGARELDRRAVNETKKAQKREAMIEIYVHIHDVIRWNRVRWVQERPLAQKHAAVQKEFQLILRDECASSGGESVSFIFNLASN